MKYEKLIILGIIVSIIFVIVGCALFSYSTETFDKIAEKFGAKENIIWNPPIPDYELPGFEGNMIINITIGIIFTILTFTIAYITGYLLKSKKFIFK